MLTACLCVSLTYVTLWQGRSHQILSGQVENHRFLLILHCICSIVKSTISMQSMLMLGGSGGMPPQKNFEKRCSEIAFLGHFQCNLDKLVGTASTVKFTICIIHMDLISLIRSIGTSSCFIFQKHKSVCT